MAMQQAESITEQDFFAEMTEIKRRLPQIAVDDNLSEWEQARMSSKTWSMEQDAKAESARPATNGLAADPAGIGLYRTAYCAPPV
jgi:hypothetical protein